MIVKVNDICPSCKRGWIRYFQNDNKYECIWCSKVFNNEGEKVNK